jgi:hypothetical protein
MAMRVSWYSLSGVTCVSLSYSANSLIASRQGMAQKAPYSPLISDDRYSQLDVDVCNIFTVQQTESSHTH